MKTECELNNILKELEYVRIVEPMSMAVPIQVSGIMSDKNKCGKTANKTRHDLILCT